MASRKTKVNKITLIPPDLKLEVLDMKLKGYSSTIMRNFISDTYPNFSEADVESVIASVSGEISRLSQDSVFDIVSKHISRYEEIYNWFRKRKYNSYARIALEYKEKLMGLHSTNVDIEINNYIGDSNNENKFFDENNLTQEEQKRFHELINKCRVL